MQIPTVGFELSDKVWLVSERAWTLLNKHDFSSWIVSNSDNLLCVWTRGIARKIVLVKRTVKYVRVNVVTGKLWSEIWFSKQKDSMPIPLKIVVDFPKLIFW